MARTAPPDWQLPDGVDRGLWDYVHDEGIARRYDQSLAGSALFSADIPFVRRHCPGPSALVDLGCGTGRLLLALAADGYSVLGVDLSAEMLGMAQAQARSLGLPVNLLRANLVHLDALADQSFDHAACLFSTLGMIVGRDNRRRMLEHAHRILRPGGRLVLHVHNRYWHLRDAAGRRWLLGDLWRSVRGHPAAGDRLMPPHQGLGPMTMHLFTCGEICALLRQVGFEVREVLPVGLDAAGRLTHPCWLGGLRAYGFLLAAERR
ncbi:MAG: class I SAM-dependent methyltransferase [Gemmataceae bacterium]